MTSYALIILNFQSDNLIIFLKHLLQLIKTKKYYTDGNFSYKEILPNKKLTQTKKETYSIEGLNLLFPVVSATG